MWEYLADITAFGFMPTVAVIVFECVIAGRLRGAPVLQRRFGLWLCLAFVPFMVACLVANLWLASAQIYLITGAAYGGSMPLRHAARCALRNRTPLLARPAGWTIPSFWMYFVLLGALHTALWPISMPGSYMLKRVFLEGSWLSQE